MIKTIPDPSPLNEEDGTNRHCHTQWKKPMTRLAVFDRSKLKQVQAEASKYPERPLSAPVEALLLQHGTVPDRDLTKEVIFRLLSDLRLATTTLIDDSAWALPLFAKVAAPPSKRATRGELIAHVNAWAKVLKVTQSKHWGVAGSASAPLPPESIH